MVSSMSMAQTEFLSCRTLPRLHDVSSGQKQENDRYIAGLMEARDQGIKSGCVTGPGWSSYRLVTMLSVALAFWYGCILVMRGELRSVCLRGFVHGRRARASTVIDSISRETGLFISMHSSVFICICSCIVLEPISVRASSSNPYQASFQPSGVPMC